MSGGESDGYRITKEMLSKHSNPLSYQYCSRCGKELDIKLEKSYSDPTLVYVYMECPKNKTFFEEIKRWFTLIYTHDRVFIRTRRAETLFDPYTGERNAPQSDSRS